MKRAEEIAMKLARNANPYRAQGYGFLIVVVNLEHGADAAMMAHPSDGRFAKWILEQATQVAATAEAEAIDPEAS